MIMWSEQAANSSQQGPQLVRSSLLQNAPNAILNNTSQTYKVAVPNQSNFLKSAQKTSMNTTSNQVTGQSPRIAQPVGGKKTQASSDAKLLNNYSRSHSRIKNK